MRRLFTLFLLAFTLTSVMWAQTMTDDQVVEYVKSARDAGKSQQQITQELMRRGVTKEQVLRIQKKYQNAGGSGEAEQAVAQLNRTREMAEDTLAGEAGARVAATPAAAVQIYGHNIFTNNRLTFEPNTNLATPANYKLGPGDEVIIDVWGTSETTIRQTITPEGSIHVTNLGPVYLSGKTVNEANAYLRQEFAKIYSGMSGSEPTTEIKLTLGAIRTIQVNIMGEVAVPGTYRLSSFSTVFHALYVAGGVNQIGSLRNIKVIRGKKTFAELDVYDLLMQGKMVDDVRLQEGDIVMVDTYEALVKISGKVKRPMYYEMKKTESLGTLLKYAGGFTGDAYTKAVRLIRKTGREYTVYNVEEFDMNAFHVADGDSVGVDSILNRYQNMAEIKGAVFRPGMYQVGGSINSVRTLIEHAEGLTEEAFTPRAVMHRMKEDRTLEVLSVDVEGIMSGKAADVPIRENDVLFIPTKQEAQLERILTIHGEVNYPGVYKYADNETLEDFVLQAGGLKETASTVKVDVARRVNNPRALTTDSVIAQTFSFALKEGFVIDGTPGFVLMPFDEVYVRKSPAYSVQQNVLVEGNVMFAGTYTLSKKEERLSDIIKKAGGLNEYAYAPGARLERRITPEERLRMQTVLQMAKAQSGKKDSVDIDKLDYGNTYYVGIELDKALENPGGDADVVLREGDKIIVPQYNGTVKISGDVMYPNTVAYEKGKKASYYIDQAGGWGNRAKKNRTYIVYMNGTIGKVGHKAKIMPGCEIIVPSKPESNGMKIGEWLTIGTSVASIATMIATIANVLK